MRFRLGVITGFGTGYYLGAKAGRQRYDQINQALRKARRSEAFQVATDRTKATVEEGVDRARDLVESRMGNGSEGGESGAPGRSG